MDKFINDHTITLGRLIATGLVIWYATGLIAIDYINPIAFVIIWIPIGLFGAYFAYKW